MRKQLSLFVPQGQFELAAITEPALDKQLLDAAPPRLLWMSLPANVPSGPGLKMKSGAQTLAG